MSEESSPSNSKLKPNVKITPTGLAKDSTMNFSKSMGTSSRIVLVHKSTSNMISEAIEKIQSRRHTVKLDSVHFEKLRVTSYLQFFREDWGGISALRYLHDGEKIAVGFNSGELQICTPLMMANMRWGPSEGILKGWEGKDSISCIQFHPKMPNFLYASSTAGFVLRRDLDDHANYNDFFISEENNDIFCIDFTNSCELVTAGRDAIIRVYDVTVDKPLREFGYLFSPSGATNSTTDYHTKRIYSVRCHPTEPSLIISGGWDGVRIWDMRMESPCIRKIDGPFIFGDTIDICNRTILTASYEAKNSLQLWDLGSGFLINNIDPSNKRVYLYGEYPYVAKFFKGDPSGDLVLFGVAGLQLISVKESSIVYLFEDERPVGAVDSTDKHIAFGGKSNTILHANILFPDTENSIGSVSYTSFATTQSPISIDTQNITAQPSTSQSGNTGPKH